jgi:hypothetical protein
MSLVERFWEKVNKLGPRQKHMKTRCWVWTGATYQDGYGHVSEGYREGSAHRVVWVWKYGSTKLCVLHRCDNPACVRLSHLFTCTHRDNSDDKIKKGRGRWLSGEFHPRAKLTDKEVDVLRRRYLEGGVTHRQLARLFGVSRAQVFRLLHQEQRI